MKKSLEESGFLGLLARKNNFNLKKFVMFCYTLFYIVMMLCGDEIMILIQ